VIARLTARIDRLPEGVVTALIMVLVTLVTTTMHTIIRMMTHDLPPFEVAFFRNLFGLVVMMPIVLRSGLDVVRTARLPLHMIRTGFQFVSMTAFFYGLSMVPLAKASALSFTSPLFATIFAILLLGERIRARRVTALVLGFVGMLVIVRPDGAMIDTGSLLIIMSAATLAGMLIAIKKLSATESNVTITVIGSTMMTTISVVPAILVWVWPTPEQVMWMFAIGALGSLAHMLVAQAMRRADASEVMPYDFTRLIWASLLGFIVFAEIPEWWTLLGGFIIFSSTVYIAFREARLSKSPVVASAVRERE
jgi:drug/metabolite transporter (DMT)-like permease